MSATGGRRAARGLALISLSGLRSQPWRRIPRSSFALVHVNLIAVGFVDTPLPASLVGNQLDARREQLSTTLPTQRGQPTSPSSLSAS